MKQDYRKCLHINTIHCQHWLLTIAAVEVSVGAGSADSAVCRPKLQMGREVLGHGGIALFA